MIEFMVIGAPRSGTTWAANWLTTDTTLCIHDPLYEYHYDELDSIKSKKHVGISCTGLLLFPDWVNRHPARKVILHRPVADINDSLRQIGMPGISDAVVGNLNRIHGMHVDWKSLFVEPRDIYEYLTELKFDAERHHFLKCVNMQPSFNQINVNKTVAKRFFNELQGLIGA